MRCHNEDKTCDPPEAIAAAQAKMTVSTLFGCLSFLFVYAIGDNYDKAYDAENDAEDLRSMTEHYFIGYAEQDPQ